MTVTLLVPNAIIFLYDMKNKDIEVPEYLANVLVSANETCISVGTQADVDGDVTLKLSNKIDKSDKDSCEKVFDGFVNTQSKKLAISTSENEGVLETDVKANKTQVSIWVDDLDFPSLVFVEAE